MEQTRGRKSKGPVDQGDDARDAPEHAFGGGRGMEIPRQHEDSTVDGYEDAARDTGGKGRRRPVVAWDAIDRPYFDGPREEPTEVHLREDLIEVGPDEAHEPFLATDEVERRVSVRVLRVNIRLVLVQKSISASSDPIAVDIQDSPCSEYRKHSYWSRGKKVV